MNPLIVLRRLPPARRNWLLFLAAGVCFGFTTGIYETSLNNFLRDVFQISARMRGILELPREMPGACLALFAALLVFLPETRIAALAAGLWALGTLGVGLFSPGMPPLVLWMVVGSTGMHLFMPVNQSIGVAVAENDRVGRKLGLLGSANTAGIILGAGVIWLGTRYLECGYAGLFTIAAAAAIVGMACLLPMRVGTAARRRAPIRLMVRRRYGLFYLLNILYGARKQLFITFGPWVLIEICGQPAAVIAVLWIVAATLGLLFKPLVGRLVDALGERLVLMGEAAALVLVCLGYAAGPGLDSAGWRLGLWLVYACFAADQVLVAAGIARTTYLCKIATDPRDLTPTLSFGISLDHVVSMAAAAAGGFVWSTFGYRYVFFGAAVIALAGLAAANGVRVAAAGSSCPPAGLSA